MSREPFEYIEFDLDYCGLTYGEGACQALLGTTGLRKCFNMFRHCQDRENFDLGVKTVRLCKPGAFIPPGMDMFPCLQDVSLSSATVNIGGMDEDMAALGRRGTLEARCSDFTYHDRFFDKYQAGRISGTAQADGQGYKPEDFGTFWSRLKARWPYHSGRPARHVQGYVDGGVLTITKTRHFVLETINVDERGAEIEAKDILKLVDNDRAVAPKQSQGVLLEDITAGDNGCTLAPEGIGDLEYPESGRALIGSELVDFTRVGDVLTFTDRGVRNTSVSDHSLDDTVQLTFSRWKAPINEVLRDLLVDYAGVNPAFIPTARWQSEIANWGWHIRLSVDIVKPEGVGDLIGELSVLGISVWWDDVNQEIGLKMIRPVDGDVVHVLTDDTAIKEIEIEDRDDERVTEIAFYHKISNPVEDHEKPESYDRNRYIVDPESKLPAAYGDTRRMEVFCRWLDHGDDLTVRVAGRRSLNRRKNAPRRYEITLDAKDDAIALTDVLRVSSRSVTDEVGIPQERLLQAISRKDPIPGHEIEVIGQSYEYEGRFGRAAPPELMGLTYDTATPEQREMYAFAVATDGATFSDGTGGYEAA